MSLKKELIKAIDLYANLMEFNGENKFKINAFKNGANTLRRVEGDLNEMVQDGSLKEVKGIGKGLVSFITEYIDNGTTSELDQLLEILPEGITEIFSVRGLGAKKIKLLFDELKIANIKDLKKACSEGKLAEIKGFTAKTEEKILDEIKNIEHAQNYLHLHKAYEKGSMLLEQIGALDSVKKIEFTGELRRIKEVISKIELMLLVDNKELFKNDLGKVSDYNTLEETNSSTIYQLESAFRLPMLLHVCYAPTEYTVNLLKTTGSEAYVSKKLIKLVSGENEKQIFDNNNTPFLIPEMREHETLNAPEHLITNSNLESGAFQGFLHFHTTYSDGMNSLSEMITGASEFGFKYAAVCDHSKSAFYANGLQEDRLLKQKEEIAKLNFDSNFEILHGIESDILRNGSLDYSDDVLKEFDFIVASVHSIFTLSKDEMTSRIITAVENKYSNLLAHPTGRLLLSRDSYEIDMDKVLDACAKNNVAIEINASPYRLDLDWRLILNARDRGCKFAINPDAHSKEEILNTQFGIMIARKGGMQIEEVINCFDLEKFKNFCNK